jgi:hypothetical protein
MKSLRCLCLALVLTLSASYAFAGDAHTPGAPEPPPPGDIHTPGWSSNQPAAEGGDIPIGAALLADLLMIIF